MFGTDPDKFYEGSKSGGRKNFRESGVKFPDGFEDLHSQEDMVSSLAALKRKYPTMRKAVVKMNDGFSGDGNAMYAYPPNVPDNLLEKSIAETLHEHLKPVSKEVSIQLFLDKFHDMGGIVEEFLDGEVKMSPSVQCVISPSGQIEMVSTHDQLLGGDDGQIFIGAIFPADKSYSVLIAEEGRKIAKTLASRGAMGRFAIDFISVKQPDDSWMHYAIEINLRKGGTTHPFLMLQFLTDGNYNADTGEYITAAGRSRARRTGSRLSTPPTPAWCSICCRCGSIDASSPPTRAPLQLSAAMVEAAASPARSGTWTAPRWWPSVRVSWRCRICRASRLGHGAWGTKLLSASAPFSINCDLSPKLCFIFDVLRSCFPPTE